MEIANLTSSTSLPANDRQPLDDAKVDAFAEDLLDILNKGAVGLMISIGHRTGLFDTMATLDWSDSVGIAATAGLDERYVREWLGAMVTGGVVEIDPAAGRSGRYRLPPEHAASLSRSSPTDNMAVFRAISFEPRRRRGRYPGLLPRWRRRAL